MTTPTTLAPRTSHEELSRTAVLARYRKQPELRVGSTRLHLVAGGSSASSHPIGARWPTRRAEPPGCARVGTSRIASHLPMDVPLGLARAKPVQASSRSHYGQRLDSESLGV